MTERNQENNGAFRARKIDFTMVSNPILRDKNVSYKAKGIYSTICMLLSIPNFKVYKSYLISQAPEGKQAFETGFKELKESGYLKVYKLHDDQNKYYYEYELLDNPESSNDEEKSPDKKVKNPDTDFRGLENQELENRVVSNNTVKNNTVSTNTILSNHSEGHIDEIRSDKEETPISISKAERQENIEVLTDNIAPDILKLKYPDEADKIDEVFNLICDTVNSNRGYIKISGENKPMQAVKHALLNLNEGHIEYILECLGKTTTKVKNPKAYLLATIYNSYFTYNNAVNLNFNHDFKDSPYIRI